MMREVGRERDGERIAPGCRWEGLESRAEGHRAVDGLSVATGEKGL